MCLVKFKIKNFKSYRDEAEFSFVAQPADCNPDYFFTERLMDGREFRLLKTAVIYGPNASGKSNFFWALRALSYFVSKSREFAVNRSIEAEPFALDNDTKSSPTEMTLDFILSGEYYSYHIEYNAESFMKEELYVVEQGVRKPVYTCHLGNIVIGEKWPSTTLDVGTSTILKNHLLLSELSVRPAINMLQVYDFISNIIAEPVREQINLKSRVDMVTSEYLHNNDTEFTQGLREIISNADMGISSIRIIEHGGDAFKFPDSIPQEVRDQIITENRWEYRFLHNGRDGMKHEMQLHNESTGTQQAFTIGTLILKALKEGGIIAYDEMGMALHPQLFKVFIQMFYSPTYNPNNAQLLFTSHDTSIIADELMRADQVWFTEKNEYGESELYSAQDFEGSKIQMPFEEFYRRGRFGARPQLNAILNKVVRS